MTDPLSPAARAVVEAAWSAFWSKDAEAPQDAELIAAAALRAAADHVEHDWDGFEIADYLCSLAAELEALPDD